MNGPQSLTSHHHHLNTELFVQLHRHFLPELVNAVRGEVDVVKLLEPVGDACEPVAAAAKAARYCMALRPKTHTLKPHYLVLDGY